MSTTDETAGRSHEDRCKEAAEKQGWDFDGVYPGTWKERMLRWKREPGEGLIEIEFTANTGRVAIAYRQNEKGKMNGLVDQGSRNKLIKTLALFTEDQR